ncbi:hypothetical protein K402DRAFT_408993 [Aulographum hederae CBS 113979]|uniref:Mating-type protein MAT-1 n=1 Tax=Aulographum hederae CBS 113979 TaxID=1176131 RepID=A0A6G1GIY8_9PEZI|nr:hypothetical protein K402DRAFT_408993 [Aulographum hederae CBS 113979]
MSFPTAALNHHVGSHNVHPSNLFAGLLAFAPNDLTYIQNLIDDVKDQLQHDPPYVFGLMHQHGHDDESEVSPETRRAAKRPLNSYMAFRSFYAPIFATYQQSQISGFFKMMWQDDPFKAKWAILAKAYSIIRDRVGKVNAPLDMFLSIAAPAVGIVPANQYLGKLGFGMQSTNGIISIVRLFVPRVHSFAMNLRVTNMTPDDVVAHCLSAGFPNVASLPNNPTNLDLNPDLDLDLDLNFDNLCSVPFEPEKEPELDPANNAANDAANAAAARNPYVQAVENTVLLAASGDQFPYNEQFAPNDESSGLYFDPNSFDKFMTFDMSFDFDVNALGPADEQWLL